MGKIIVSDASPDCCSVGDTPPTNCTGQSGICTDLASSPSQTASGGHGVVRAQPAGDKWESSKNAPADS